MLNKLPAYRLLSNHECCQIVSTILHFFKGWASFNSTTISYSSSPAAQGSEADWLNTYSPESIRLPNSLSCSSPLVDIENLSCAMLCPSLVFHQGVLIHSRQTLSLSYVNSFWNVKHGLCLIRFEPNPTCDGIESYLSLPVSFSLCMHNTIMLVPWKGGVFRFPCDMSQTVSSWSISLD